MDSNKFLAKIDEFIPSDYVRAGFVSFYYDNESGLFEVSKTPDDGDVFLVYLVKKHDKNIECINTVKTYKEARQLFDKLRAWLSEDEWGRVAHDNEWSW
jgi:hypothetical protein